MKYRATILQFILVTIALAIATYIAWWGVAVAAGLYGVLTYRRTGGPLLAALAAIAAWEALLLLAATRGPVTIVASTVGGVLQVRAVAVYVITLAFPGLLALSAAVVARAVARMTIGQSSS